MKCLYKIIPHVFVQLVDDFLGSFVFLNSYPETKY